MRQAKANPKKHEDEDEDGRAAFCLNSIGVKESAKAVRSLVSRGATTVNTFDVCEAMNTGEEMSQTDHGRVGGMLAGASRTRPRLDLTHVLRWVVT